MQTRQIPYVQSAACSMECHTFLPVLLYLEVPRNSSWAQTCQSSSRRYQSLGLLDILREIAQVKADRFAITERLQYSHQTGLSHRILYFWLNLTPSDDFSWKLCQDELSNQIQANLSIKKSGSAQIQVVLTSSIKGARNH